MLDTTVHSTRSILITVLLRFYFYSVVLSTPNKLPQKEQKQNKSPGKKNK